MKKRTGKLIAVAVLTVAVLVACSGLGNLAWDNVIDPLLDTYDESGPTAAIVVNVVVFTAIAALMLYAVGTSKNHL